MHVIVVYYIQAQTYNEEDTLTCMYRVRFSCSLHSCNFIIYRYFHICHFKCPLDCTDYLITSVALNLCTLVQSCSNLRRHDSFCIVQNLRLNITLPSSVKLFFYFWVLNLVALFSFCSSCHFATNSSSKICQSWL